MLCARVKEIRSIFFERTAKAYASPKQKEDVKKNTFSLIIAYVFFANQKEEVVFLDFHFMEICGTIVSYKTREWKNAR